MFPSLSSTGIAGALLFGTAAAAAEPPAAAAPPAAAEPPSAAEPRAAAAPSESGDENRYDWLLAELDENGKTERTWWTTWTASYAALAAGQGAAAWLITDEGLRADATVGAVKSALGFLALLITPRSAIGAASTLRSMDASTPEARGLRRARAEDLLHASAKEEAFGTSWVPHVAAAITNLAGAYVLFHEHERYLPGWISLASGTLVAELQIVTQPTGAIVAWNRYAGGTAPTGSGRTSAPRVTLSIAPTFGGFVAGGSF